VVKKPPVDDVGDDELALSEPKTYAAGVPAIRASMANAVEQMGVRRSALTLLRVNQKSGFDCPGCAWPESKDSRHIVEFCENGAKAVAEEATVRRVDRSFFADHSVADLEGRTGFWLGQQGRLTEPMVKQAGADHYEPISWDDAFALIAGELRALASPDEAIFYTSGRTSNEAAFSYQVFVRQFGTNNLPDCSNMCHESSGSALSETIGVGKGSVLLEDLEQANLIFIVGQNPGTNHPRMLSTLEKAKKAGARIIAVNPLPEAGLMNFHNPQRPSGIVGHGTALADRFLQIRVGGDLALFQALGRLLFDADEKTGGVLDHAFIETHTAGFAEYAAHLAGLSWDDVLRATGLTRAEIDATARDVLEAKNVVVCWAMGLTQHRHSVPTIREIVNFLLLRGNIGRPGAGVCPVRGHSNVQGDRTMGIYEKPPAAFLDRLGAEFDFEPPREHGLDTVDSIRAMRDGRAKVFFAMGGNFAAATPDTAVTEAALRRCRLTVHVSTKLNRSHTVTGERALILPTLGRTDLDVQAAGPQHVSVEDSMGMVHSSRGRLKPASKELLSEVAIICRLAKATLSDRGTVDWSALEGNYDRIRDHIGRVVPGFEEFNAKLAEPGGFILPHAPRDKRSFPTLSGKANFTANELEFPQAGPGELVLQTVRSHDQYNTTIYGLDDRYRGVKQGRRVVFVNPDDLAALELTDGTMVDISSVWKDNADRTAKGFRIVAYPTARGCCAAYFPETNVLVPLDSTAKTSNTPTSKSIIVRLTPA